MLLRDRKQHAKDSETLADGPTVIEEPKSHTDPTNFSSKEQAIWERLREEHHETIDQLPLTLTRQLALLQELDRQSDVLGSQILPMLHAYSIMRGLTDTHDVEYMSTLSRQEALSRVIKLSEDALRMSEEKMYLAQAAQDTVERHVRILEQASHEIEAMVSIDKPLGLNPAPFTLPDLSVPRWAKHSRVIDSSEDESTPELYPQAGLEVEIEKMPRKKASKKSTNQRGTFGQQSIKLLIRGTAAPSTVQDDAPTDTKTYCYCDSVSFGEMIACDNSKCQREWFHLGCAGLTVPPEGKWFCKDCSPGKKRKRTH